MSTALAYIVNGIQRWVTILGLLRRAGPSVVTVAVVVNLAIGLLPFGLVLGTSMLIGWIHSTPDATDSSTFGTVPVAVTIAGVALLLQSAVAPFQLAVGELVTRMVDGHSIRRLMRIALVDVPASSFARSDVLALINDARSGLLQNWQTPGSAAAGMLALVARYAQMLAATLLLAFVLGPLAATVLAATVLVVRFAYRMTFTRYSRFWNSLRDDRQGMDYVLDSGVDPAFGPEVRVLGIQDWFRSRATRESTAYWTELWRVRLRMYFLPFVGYTVILVAGLSVVVLMLRARGLSGSLSAAELALALQAILVAIPFAAFFPEADVATEWGLQTQDAISELDRRHVTTPSGPTPQQPVASPRSSIRFEGVRFTYPGAHRPALNNLDLDLRVGESTAVVGLNGAGKTTLVNLLCRIHEPDRGRILVDGHDLADYEQRAWQRKVAVIFQNFLRSELDARTNVELGAPGRADEASFRTAVERAGATDIIAGLPHGSRTVLSSRYRDGVDLSGGQWQRVALARALLAVAAGAEILVLDEPTAQLDVRAEVAFFDSFLDLTRELTTLVISHRFSTVRRADRIVVLAEGHVVEDGTHEQLMAAGGRYAELFTLQAQRFTKDGTPDLCGHEREQS